MKLGFEIFLIFVGVWFLGGAIRSWPPGTYRPNYLHPSKPGDFVMAFLHVSTAWATAAALICGASWWWILLLIGLGAIILFSIIIGRLRYG